jgi:hypothetical protein
MTNKSKNSQLKKKPRSLYTVHPWQCIHRKECSEITAYVEASGDWETVLVVKPTSGASAEHIAIFVCAVINDHIKSKNLLHDAMHALELVMSDGLNFTSEQAIEKVAHRIKAKIG